MPVLALFGGSPVRDAPWPRWPQRDEAEEAAMLEALRAGDWGGFPMPNVATERFARAFAERCDSSFCQCVCNGTVALEVAVQALGIEPGAEVIVPAYTFEATAAAVLFSGCVPVLVDVDPDTYCLSPEAAESAITSRTQALLPVHLGMSLADMDALGGIAERFGLKVLEDCAHAHGAAWRGRAAGSLGDAGCFSFQTSKLMTAGEGGAITTSDEDVMDVLYALVNCGRQRPGRRCDRPVVGHNYRLTDLQAALLEPQLDRLSAQHAARAENAALLCRLLGEIEGLEPLEIDGRVTTQAIYQFVLKYDGQKFRGVERDAVVAALCAEGVPCEGVFYQSLQRSPLLQRDAARYPAWSAAAAPSDCPVAERAAYRESIWLSHHLLLGSEADTSQIAEAFAKVTQNVEELIGAEHPAIERQRLSRTSRE